MKYTPERVEKIIDLISKGNYKETAALASGISEATLYDWQKKYPEFFEAVKKAEAEAEEKYVEVIKNAAKTSWQAAAWWLERTKYTRWGRKDRHEITGENGEPLQFKIDSAYKPKKKNGNGKSNKVTKQVS